MNKIFVGDYVQWDSQGVYQFDSPKEVVKIEQDYAFFAGSYTGVPVKELVVKRRKSFLNTLLDLL